MNHSLHDAMPVCNLQRCLEELEQQILALEQEPRGPEEHSLSDSEVVSDSDDERYETVAPCLAARLSVWQKIKHELPISQGDISSRGPLMRLSS